MKSLRRQIISCLAEVDLPDVTRIRLVPDVENQCIAVSISVDTYGYEYIDCRDVFYHNTPDVEVKIRAIVEEFMEDLKPSRPDYCTQACEAIMLTWSSIVQEFPGVVLTTNDVSGEWVCITLNRGREVSMKVNAEHVALHGIEESRLRSLAEAVR